MRRSPLRVPLVALAAGANAARVLLQCAAYTAFHLAIGAYYGAKTVDECQVALDTFVTFGVLIHAVYLHLYAYLGARRDYLLRALSTGVLVCLAVVHQWAPLRGTVIELQTVQMPGGVSSLVPIRTPANAALGLLYGVVLLNNLYGFFVAHLLWQRDRAGAVLVGGASVAVLVGAVIGFLIDYAGLRAPYVGGWMHAFFVFCMVFFLSREYENRRRRVAATDRQFGAAFEHAPIGKALLAPDGHILEVNRALCRMLGWTTEELCARSLAEIGHPDDRGEPELERLHDAPAYSVEKRLLRKDGELVWVRLAVSVVPDDRGRPLRIVAQMLDMTELRAHREKLEELVLTRTGELEAAKNEAERANRAKSLFLAHISHEIRTPLHVMLAHAQSLERDPAVGPPQRTKLGTLVSSGRHLQTLIDSLLEMSKIEAGRPELVESPFDPWGTLLEVQRMFTAEAASRALELSIEHTGELPARLRGDGGKVKQILINLVGNALKFTAQGAVLMRASARELADGSQRVEVVVSDTGIGIQPEDAPRIFQPFEQLEAGKIAGGTGLGLAISLAHARLMGGDLRVESTPGVGSRFTFSFVAQPVMLGERPSAPAQPAPADAGARCKALIVDDVALNRDLLSEFLSGSGFETRTAAEGADAVSIHAAWQPDLVLIDLRMHGMSGVEAIRLIRDTPSRAAIGALSASVLDEDERMARAFGADFFMRKPYDYGELLDQISRVLPAPPAQDRAWSSRPQGWEHGEARHRSAE